MDLSSWFGPHLAPGGAAWLATAAAPGLAVRDLAIRLGQAPRRVGRAPLPEGPGGWPRGWRTDQAVRVALVQALPAEDPVVWLAALDRLFATADLEELVALYQGLALLPHPGRLAARAAEGVRSNMVAVFAAVALDNPYPAAHLDEGAWNQLVLKAVFTGADLDRITGLTRRHNATLRRMLADLVRERRAAGRPIDPRVLPLAD